MILPTMDIMRIVNKWAAVLTADAAINAFCMDKYGRAPKVLIGIDERNPPSDQDDTNFPYIVLYPGPVVEGLNQTSYTYTISAGWVVYQENKTTSGQITSYNGIEECSALGQLIYKAVGMANEDYPITNVDKKAILTAYQPQYAGMADFDVSIPVTMGVDMEY